MVQKYLFLINGKISNDVFFLFGIANAQSNYYYNGQKKYLTLHKKSFNIFTNSNFQTSSTANIGVENYVLIEDQSNINISNYLTGIYTVALVVNGEVVDSKTLIKQ